MNQRVKWFEVWDNYSEDGRGGLVKVIGRFTYESVAKDFAKGRGNYGGDALVDSVEMYIADSIESWQKECDDEKKVAALKKLTSEERKLLGV